jgi:F-type H+-transporting ATPase subunit gamma
MPSIKDLRKRIASTKNTQQTTRAMKMVSAAKLRRAQEAVTAQRPYAKRLDELIRTLAGMDASGMTSALFGREQEEGYRKKLLLVLISSDRGLCGGFNANIIKSTQRWLAANRDQYESIQIDFVGKKAFDFFKTKGIKVHTNHTELSGKVTYEKARRLGDSLVKTYLDGEFDEVKIVYNEFKNAVSQVVRVEDYLPLKPHTETAPADTKGVETLDNYILKPGHRELLEKLLGKQFTTQAFRYMLESQASEHGARMSAMENATKNAGEMIKKLTLQYNKQRQASITKELLEIIAGSESQKG